MIRRKILSLMLLAAVHASFLPALPAFAAPEVSSVTPATVKATEALERVKTFDDAVNFFYGHQLFAMGATISGLLERNGISPKEAFPQIKLMRGQVISPSLKWPVLIKSTRPLLISYGDRKWAPDAGKTPEENLGALVELLAEQTTADSGLFPFQLIPEAHAYSKKEKLLIGVGAAFGTMMLAGYMMSTGVSEAVTFASAFLMLGLGGVLAYVGHKSLSEAAFKAIAKAHAGERIPYIPSKVVSCSPGEIQFRSTEGGSAETYTMRVNRQAEGGETTVSFLDEKGAPLAGAGGPYPLERHKVSLRGAKMAWGWSKKADEAIAATLGMPKGVRIDAAALEEAFKQPKNRDFAGKLGSSALFFDTWERVCGTGTDDSTIARENARLDVSWKSLEKAKEAPGRKTEGGAEEREQQEGNRKAD